jgi:hypothetical protein
MMMTFALGTACVFVSDPTLKTSENLELNLPELQTESVIFVTPRPGKCITLAGNSHAGPIEGKDFVDCFENELTEKITRY